MRRRPQLDVGPVLVDSDDIDVCRLSVSVVMPTLNEAANLPHVFARLPAGLHEVIIVDGRSVDDTVEVAWRLRSDVKVVTQKHKGKGDAVACGIAAATGDVIALIDADGSTDPAEIPRFVAALVAGADFATGSRYLEGGGSDDLTWYRSMGCRVLSSIANLLFGTKYTDINYGYNVFRTSCLEVLRVDCTGFELEALLNVRAGEAWTPGGGSTQLRAVQNQWIVEPAPDQGRPTSAQAHFARAVHEDGTTEARVLPWRVGHGLKGEIRVPTDCHRGCTQILILRPCRISTANAGTLGVSWMT